LLGQKQFKANQTIAHDDQVPLTDILPDFHTKRQDELDMLASLLYASHTSTIKQELQLERQQRFSNRTASQCLALAHIFSANQAIAQDDQVSLADILSGRT
jgi:hypothetical protein